MPRMFQWTHDRCGVPIDPIAVSSPGDADKVVTIESRNEAGVDMVTVDLTDGEIQSMPMIKVEARTRAQRCLGPDEITDTTKNEVSYRWTRLPHSE